MRHILPNVDPCAPHTVAPTAPPNQVFYALDIPIDPPTPSCPATTAPSCNNLFTGGPHSNYRENILLLSAHPDGLVVGEIQEELDIPNSTLSHHLDKLRNEGLVSVQRESTFLRYSANTQSLQELLQFLYAECCTRNKALRPQDVIQICK
jgi:ArsR family transcriptional regulator, arsenate/arsenite/antimonite-responsive transcriptional repressor